MIGRDVAVLGSVFGGSACMAVGLEDDTMVVVETAVVSVYAGAGMMELVTHLFPLDNRAPTFGPVGRKVPLGA